MSAPTNRPRPSGPREGGPGGKRRYIRKTFCRFCAEKDTFLDYKTVPLMRQFISERGKIVPRRISGTCAGHQRKLTVELKKARIVALVPFTATQVR